MSASAADKYEGYVRANFGDTFWKDTASKSTYLDNLSKGDYGAAITQATGSTDPTVISEIQRKQSTSGKNWFSFLDSVAADPTSYSPTLVENNITTTAQKRSEPQIANLKATLGENQLKSEERANAALATRGISTSGAVGANYLDLADKYAKALASGTNDIISANTADVSNKSYGEYDQAVAQRYAEKIATEQQTAYAAAQKEPTIFDWIGGVLGIGNQVKNLVTNPYEELLKKQNNNTKGVS